MNDLKIYHISRGYRILYIIVGDKFTGQRISSRTVRCNAGMSRIDRYEEVCRVLKEEGLTPPQYRAANTHSRCHT